jgi:hypothetical protein
LKPKLDDSKKNILKHLPNFVAFKKRDILSIFHKWKLKIACSLCRDPKIVPSDQSEFVWGGTLRMSNFKTKINTKQLCKIRVSAIEAFRKTTVTEVSSSKISLETSGFRTETSSFQTETSCFWKPKFRVFNQSYSLMKSTSAC